jgi:signal transduction histidine kinase
MGGTGLGLSIVKHAIEQMKGTVAVESELGQGSRFIIVLPANGAT